MRAATTVAVALVVIAFLATVATASSGVSSERCSDFTRCSECVFDATNGVFSRTLNCTWCPTEKKCVETGSTEANTCQLSQWENGIREVKCEDMKCSAAATTNNIYICRPTMMTALVATIVLIILTMFYGLWYKAIIQCPWRYPNIHQATKEYIAMRGSVLASFAPTEDHRAATTRNFQAWAPQDPNAIPPEEQHWSTVARWAFFPLVVGAACSFISLVLLLSVSLKPWFADYYYGLLLGLPYVTYFSYCAWVRNTRMPIPGDERGTLSVFFLLAWTLRGRSLRSVFQVQDDESSRSENARNGSTPRAVAVADGAPNATATPKLPPGGGAVVTIIDKQKKADTTKLLNFESDIEKNFRKKLRDILETDEHILWWEKPRRQDIIVDNRWLIHFFATNMVLGLWLWGNSGIKESEYALARFFSDTGLAMIGFIFFAVFLFLISITIHGCNRLYVMTNKRLMYLADGLVGSTHVNFTDITKIKCASVVSYQDLFFDTIWTFSWEAPMQQRKLPPIKTNAFPCIRQLDTFLPLFRETAGPLESDILEENHSHLRQVWRMHIFLNILVAAILPIFFIYAGMTPYDLGFIGMLIFLSFTFCFIQRGMRVQQKSVVPLNLAKEWSKWDADRGSIAQTFLKKLFSSGSGGAHDGEPTSPNAREK